MSHSLVYTVGYWFSVSAGPRPSRSNSMSEAVSPCISKPEALPSSSPLTFIIDVCGVLKRLKRQGWVRRQVPLPESISDHLHRTAMLSMLYHNVNDDGDENELLDYTDCPEFHPDLISPTMLLRMAVSHDLCEAIAGDVTPHCVNSDSRIELEEKAMQHIARVIGGSLGQELADLWKEYEEQTTALAIVVKDLDKFEMLAQAYEYESQHLVKLGADLQQDVVSSGGNLEEPLRDFFQSQQGKMKTPLFRKLDAELRVRRINLLVELGWDITEGET